MKFNLSALKRAMALLCVAGCFSFSIKNEIVQGKAGVQVLTDTLIVSGQIASATPVALKNCPFPATDIFIKEDDLGEWDHNSIVKYTYHFGSIVSYFISNKKDQLKTLVIFHNPAENKDLKMAISGTRLDESSVSYRFASAEDVLHLEITVRDEKEGYDVNIGRAIDFASLGSYTVNGYGRTSQPCQGFQACLLCQYQHCQQSWLCSIGCGIGTFICLTGWIAACSANP